MGLNRRSGDGEAPKIRVTGSCATQSSKPSSQQAQDFLEARRAVANAKLAEEGGWLYDSNRDYLGQLTVYQRRKSLLDEHDKEAQ